MPLASFPPVLGLFATNLATYSVLKTPTTPTNTPMDMVYLLESTEVEELLVLKKDLFDLDVNNSMLSPGQQYLLRIAVACYCNVADEFFATEEFKELEG